MRNRLWCLVGTVALCCGGALIAAASKPPVQKASPLTPYLKGKATAIVFVATQCPIANRHAPEIAALGKRARASGGSLVLVYSNPGDQAGAKAHAKKFGLSGLPVILDSDQSLQKALGATVTPHAFVLAPTGKVLYSGRISDDGAGPGKPKGANPLHHELADALNAALAGQPIKVAKTEAVGCEIEARVAEASGPTYATEIAPILNKSCVSCHRAGEIGPMRLDTYEHAKKFAANIAKVTEAKVMPPWKPTDDCGDFVGVRKLSEKQIGTLAAWAKAGAPAGNLTKAPMPPSFTSGWRLGKPDLVLTMPVAWKVAATGEDIYRCFVLPTNLTEDKEVVAVEYRAGNKAVVHHVLGYVDTQGRARRRDAAEDGPGYTSFGGPGFFPDGEVGGWAPGNLPQFLPDGIARPLPKGSDVVIQVHYHANGKPEEDITSVGLYFGKKKATKYLQILPLVAGLNIPPGEGNYKTSMTFGLPFDSHAIFIVPHMHLLGKSMEVTATLPDGSTKPMIRIDDWDFNWQDTYTYKDGFALPKGTKLGLKAVYDNSVKNPRQPNNPPKAVSWGEATTDEMCIAFIGYVADNPNDPAAKLFSMIRRRE